MATGWKSIPLGEIAPAKSNPMPPVYETVWNLSLDQIEPETGRIISKTHCKVSDLGSAKCSFDHRHVLYSKLRPYLNKVVVPDAQGVGTSELIPMLPNPNLIDREFLAYYLRSRDFLEFAKKNTRGANLPLIAMSELWRHKVSVPDSLDEQRRIVTRIKECMDCVREIETLQSSLEADYSALYFSTSSHVVENLKHDWETKKIGELVADDKTAMRSGPFGSAMKHHEFIDDGNLVIGIANVQINRFDPVRKWMITDKKFKEMERYQVNPGDVLITIMGTIGRTCVVPRDVGKAITSKHVYRIRFPQDQVIPEFISYIINYDYDARRQLYGTAIGGVMPGLNATKLRDLRICVPPVDVQASAVSELDEMHSAIRERDSMDIKNDVPHLRQSILYKAFSGEL